MIAAVRNAFYFPCTLSPPELFLSCRSEHHRDDEKLRGAARDQQQLRGRGDSRAFFRPDICRVRILSLQTEVRTLIGLNGSIVGGVICVF